MKKNELVTNTRIKNDREVRSANQEAEKKLIASEANENASRVLAQARESEAAAKGQAATQEEEKVIFEQRLRLSAIDAKLAGKGMMGNLGIEHIDIEHVDW